MTTYVLLANWTEQGIRDIKDSPQRLDTAKKMLQDMGGSIKSFFLTMGDFDIVAIYEAPDDAIAARFVIRSEEHTSELQSLMRISYAVFCLKKKQKSHITKHKTHHVLH